MISTKRHFLTEYPSLRQVDPFNSRLVPRHFLSSRKSSLPVSFSKCSSEEQMKERVLRNKGGKEKRGNRGR